MIAPMKSALALALAFAALALPAAAQSPPKYGCDAPEFRQLDFWLGEWELAYAEGRSRNRITKTLDGCAVLEEFTGAPGTKLDGRSVSTWDAAAKRWRQVWVDNTGAWLDFTGGLEDGRMVLARQAEKDGKRFLQRMVFDAVAKDSLKWLWQRSDDGGRTWKTTWEIDYRRAK